MLRDVFLSNEVGQAPRRALRELCAGNGQYGTSEKSSRSDGGVPVLRMGNIVDGAIDWSDLVYSQLSESEERKYELADGDLLFNRTNSAELVGKTAVFESGRRAVFASYLIRFRLDPALADPCFVSAYINSRYGREFIVQHMTRAIGQVNISASVMHRMPIPAIPVERQRKLGKLIADGKRVLSTAAQAQEAQRSAIKTLPAAFLRQAFSGGLLKKTSKALGDI